MTGPLVVRRFGAGMSTIDDPATAIGEAVGAVMEQLGDAAAPPDLAVLFVSGRHTERLADFVDVVRTMLRPTTFLAATAAGVLSGGAEVEDGPAVSLWAGNTGPVVPLRLEPLDSRPDSTVLGLADDLDPGSTVLVLADPFTFPADGLIAQLPADVALVGGLASAAASAGDNRLWLDGAEFDDGAVAVAFPPGVAQPVVSQGCRPVGSAWVVTAGERNLIHQLGGQPAVDRLQELIAGLSPEDRNAASRGLHLGIVANEQRDAPGRGDFLIRGVLGIEQTTQALAVADRVEVGQLVQFQVRDPSSATADLEMLMSDAAPGAQGALVFTCTGRGTRLFDEPHHDASIVAEHVNGGVGGMFCAGELGPIGNRNAVHGFTATVVAFQG